MDETRATYGTTRTLNLQLTDAEGYKRTIKIKNPKSDTTARKSATDNFVNNFILDDSKNVVAGANGSQSIVGVVADYVETTTINDGSYGESAPYVLSNYSVTVSNGNPATIEVLNITSETVTVDPATQIMGNPTTSVSENIITVRYGSSPVANAVYIVKINNTPMLAFNVTAVNS